MNLFCAMSSYSWYDFSDATIGLLFGLAGVLFGYALRGLIGKFQADAVEKQAKTKLEEADVEIKNRLKEADIQARAEVIQAREAFEKTAKAQRAKLQETENRLASREQSLDEKALLLEKKDQSLLQRRDELDRKSEEVAARQQNADKAAREADGRLAKLAGMTAEDAKRKLFERADEELRQDAGIWIRRVQEEARNTADREAQQIVVSAIQRYATTHAHESMSCTVSLESDDVKGRIIGREGRNIRSLEATTGTTMLIDDTPGAVVISAFDPIRREVARLTLEQLISDGRIHPARIEEVFGEVSANMNKAILEAGENAAFQAQVQNLPTEVLRMLGRLKFRTSFSQNVLQHSVEVANLMGMMAGELGLDPSLARRAGLLHDIGKAMDHEKQGKHALLGADFLKKNGESDVIVNAVGAHHEDLPCESHYAVLCSAADAISSSRPGARMESTEIYVERLKNLEEIANGFPGVSKTYALQAGREIRVIVDPGRISDNDASVLARDISKKIEATMHYPGQIKVIVVRETRCIEYAR